METTKAKQRAFLRLWIKRDLNQKQIAETIGVTPATVCKWVGMVKDEYQLIYSTRKAIIKRLDTALLDNSTTPTDIHNLTTSLSVIQKQFNNVPNTLLFVLSGKTA